MSVSSDNETDGEDKVIAGDWDHGGAIKEYHQVRNRDAHLMVPLTPLEVVHSAGEPERGSAINTRPNDNSTK